MTYEITTFQDTHAPPSNRWVACFGDYDLDVPTGHGATEEEAAVDLIEMHGLLPRRKP